MLKHVALVLLCGLMLSACVPGPVLRSPPVVGTVFDARTRHGLPGARVSIAIPSEPSSAGPLPDTVSDADGHFTLESRYKFGLAAVLGDPAQTRAVLRFSKEGYTDVEVHTLCNLNRSLQAPLREAVALEPTPASPGGKKATNL